jgi:hypothetical protein
MCTIRRRTNGRLTSNRQLITVGERMSPATPNKPGLPEGPIEPFDLAFACYLYESMTPYKGGLDRFRATTGAAPDLKREDHRLALLKFLNDWGCRNLAKEWHGLASEELDRWYSGAEDLLRLPDGSRADRDMTRLGDLTTVFDSLSTCIAARKVSPSSAHLGPDPSCDSRTPRWRRSCSARPRRTRRRCT